MSRGSDYVRRKKMWTIAAGLTQLAFTLSHYPLQTRYGLLRSRKVSEVGLILRTTIVILKRLLLVSEKASEDLKDLARAWIDKISVKNGTYPPDSYPNPGMVSLNGA